MQKNEIIFVSFFIFSFCIKLRARLCSLPLKFFLSIFLCHACLLTIHNLIDCPRWTSLETWFCSNRLMTTEVVFNYKISRLLLSIIHQNSHVFLKNEQAVVHLQGIEQYFFFLSPKNLNFAIHKRKTYRFFRWWYATARVFEWIFHKNDLKKPNRSSSSSSSSTRTTYL